MSTAVAELRQFVTFLGTLWGALAGVSMFFPLANTFVGAIPVGLWDQYAPEGGLIYISPEIVAATASLGASFMTLWLFSHRYEFLQDIERATVRRRAGVSFVLGILALLVYLVANFAIYEGFYWEVLGLTMDEPVRIVGDIVLLTTYSGFFVLMTRAFVLLGMLEYYVSG